MKFAHLIVLLTLAPLGCEQVAPSVDDATAGSARDGVGGKADGLELDRDTFFAREAVWYVRIEGWPRDRMAPASLAEAIRIEGAKLSIFAMDPDSEQHCPDAEVGEADRIFASDAFELRTSGNFTNGTPKSSYKVKLKGGKEGRFLGMKAINLKSMWNDVSQMREAIAWGLFADAGVHAPRHTYARFCINDRYYGLYSVIEQVDSTFLKDRFGKKNDEGNLYKAYWEDLGPADLTHRVGEDGDDSGAQYFEADDVDLRTYQLKTNEDEPELATYDDLAALVRVINGKALFDADGAPSDDPARFESEAWAAQIEGMFDVYGFLRWAGTNLLLGAWDNYWGTPANYYLYNAGKAGGGEAFMEAPYFVWIPWDYDNSLGSDMFDVKWQYADLLDIEAATYGYYDDRTSKLPLITNLLRNPKYRAYYLDHIEWMLDARFNPTGIAKTIGDDQSGLWSRVRRSAFLEADGPQAAAHTGRAFTNDQVYWNGLRMHELVRGEHRLDGIEHYVRMRHDSARDQLDRLAEDGLWQRGDAQFPAQPTALPDAD